MPDNSLKSSDILLDKTLARLYTHYKFVKTSFRLFEDKYKNFPVAPGDTLNYRLPLNFVPVEKLDTSADSDRSSIIQRQGTLKVDQEVSIHTDLTAAEATLDLQDNKKKYIDKILEPQAFNIASNIESRVVDKVYKTSYLTMGKIGSNLSRSGVLQLRAKVKKIGINMDQFYFGMPEEQSAYLAEQLGSGFNEKYSTKALDEGFVGRMSGIDMFESEFLGYHTAGAGGLDSGSAPSGMPDDTKECGQLAAAIDSNGSVDGVKQIQLTNLPVSESGVLVEGDILVLGWDGSIKFKNYFTRTNPEYYVQVAVVSDPDGNKTIDSDGSGNATVVISDPIYTEGPYANTTGVIPENAYVSMYKSHHFGLAYHNEGIVFAQPQLNDLKGGVIMSTTRQLDMEDGNMPIALSLGKAASLDKWVQSHKYAGIFGVTTNPRLMIRYIF